MTRYELLDRIGVGGMAEIFRGKAVAAGGFEKPVAIKRILPHLSQDTRFVELLIAEAKVLSLLKHRNIVQIFDVGLGDDGQYFLVMEHVDGKDLGAVQRGLEARRVRMPFDLALHIGAEICEALEHAHHARAPDGKPMSLVHRDVSPSNVMLSRAGEIKLTDFGIAKRAEQEVTGHGAVRGKFAYISPEQARNEHIDPRSDVFSVAIVLWELIANRRLFSGLGDLEALRAVREAQVPRLIEADPRLPAEVDQLVMSALDRDLKKRPTAEQLAARLRTIRYGLEVTVGDPATELAKIIDTADEVARESQRLVVPAAPAPPRLPNLGSPRAPQPGGFEPEQTEATVIRIRTADAFQARDIDGGMARARAVIDRFDDEETRQAQLSGDQLRILRAERENSDLISPLLPGLAPGPRARRTTDEPTAAREPITTGEVPTMSIDERMLPANQRFDDESTWLLDRRQPMPPDMPPVMLTPTPPPPAVQVAGTVHQRNPQRAPQRPFPEPHSVSSRSGQMPLEAPSETPVPLTPPSLPSRAVHANPHASVHPPGHANPAMHPGSHQAPQRMPSQAVPQAGPLLPPLPLVQPPPVMPGNFPGWGAQPQGSGYVPQSSMMTPNDRASHAVLPGRYDERRRRPVLKPWMLVVGALVMAALAFAVTRWFLS